ncbi:hypothetical protein M0R45_026278 [Rubus argutus]|uniref:Uncharacterized protein n=1 Tax=Rubus argutus TaxID=59490 RepID=A0AAW1WXQ4_RUBAR
MRRYDGREKRRRRLWMRAEAGLCAQACELEKKSWIDDGIGHGYRQRSKAVAACDCGRRCRRGVEARGALVNRRCWAEGKIAVVEHGRGDAGGST